MSCSFFFFNDTATTEIYTLSLHDALPISRSTGPHAGDGEGRQGPQAVSLSPPLAGGAGPREVRAPRGLRPRPPRSEEHTSELQSLAYLVCRLLLEKKKKQTKKYKLSHSNE